MISCHVVALVRIYWIAIVITLTHTAIPQLFPTEHWSQEWCQLLPATWSPSYHLRHVSSESETVKPTAVTQEVAKQSVVWRGDLVLAGHLIEGFQLTALHSQHTGTSCSNLDHVVVGVCVYSVM
jgi:hypothetical protein